MATKASIPVLLCETRGGGRGQRSLQYALVIELEGDAPHGLAILGDVKEYVRHDALWAAEGEMKKTSQQFGCLLV